MPNIKSQKKRAMTNLKRNAIVSSEKSALKTAILTSYVLEKNGYANVYRVTVNVKPCA